MNYFQQSNIKYTNSMLDKANSEHRFGLYAMFLTTDKNCCPVVDQSSGQLTPGQLTQCTKLQSSNVTAQNCPIYK